MKVTLHLEGNKDALVAGAQEFIKNLLGESVAEPKKRGRPAKTVSDDEEEDFGKKPLSKKDLSADDEEEESEEEETEESSDDEEEESDELTFGDITDAINEYGEKHVDEMKAILLSHNIKSTKELKLHPKKWEPVYRKVMTKLAGLKSKKGKK
jgi:hypothetical protein